MAKRWGKQRGAGGPRRSWHGADREVALFETHRKEKRRKRRLRDGTIFAVALVATIGGGLAVTRDIWSQPGPRLPEPQPTPRQPDPSQTPDKPPTAPNPPEEPHEPDATSRTFGFCHEGGGTNCVVDGDTFWMDGIKIRVADIDTPETHPPRCAREAELGNRATERFRALLNAGPISLVPIDRDEDRYGRKLLLVMRDGRSLGDTLVAEGLARPYRGGPRPGWCD